MADGDPSEPRMTLRGVPVAPVRSAVQGQPEPPQAPEPERAPAHVPLPEHAHTADPAFVSERTPAPVPNPAMLISSPGRMTAPMPQQPPVAAPAYPQPMPHQPDGTLGDGPIRVVCRRCQRTVWGWKLPFGVSCPMGPHHSHINWFLVGVVASFWAAFVVVIVSLIGIAAG